MSSKHFIGIHGYVLVYSIASRQSFETVQVIADKILNALVGSTSVHDVLCSDRVIGSGTGAHCHCWKQE